MSIHPEERMIALIRKIRETLQGYADHHLAKNPPQPEKAQVNMNLVHEINGALIALATPPTLQLTEEMMEAVRDPDIFKPGQIVRHPPAVTPIPSIPHLTKLVEDLKGCGAGETVAIEMSVGDLRALVGVDEAQPA